MVFRANERRGQTFPGLVRAFTRLWACWCCRGGLSNVVGHLPRRFCATTLLTLSGIMAIPMSRSARGSTTLASCSCTCLLRFGKSWRHLSLPDIDTFLIEFGSCGSPRSTTSTKFYPGTLRLYFRTAPRLINFASSSL